MQTPIRSRFPLVLLPTLPGKTLSLRFALTLAATWLTLASFGSAQESFWARYQARVNHTLDGQPHWVTPLVTVNPSVEPGFRADFTRQTATVGGARTWNLGGTKGLEIVPLPRLELRFSPPPFLFRAGSKAEDGFGDFAFRIKARLYGSNEQHHNAIATVYMGASVPTGKGGNGSCCAILTPFLELGKGFGHLAFISSAGGSLPVSGTTKLGRAIIFNNAIEYNLGKHVWLQTEFNSTFFKGGSSDGKQQTFFTPGILIRRLPLIRGVPGKADPLSLTLGAGEQIALTHFNNYNHAPVFSGRLRF